MSEVIKRYTFFAYLDDDVAELDCHEEEDGNYVLASDYDRDTKALEDKARNQHARDSVELRDLCSQRDGFKAELWRAKGERDKLAAELAELKAVMAESLDNYRAMLHASEAQVEELKAKMEGAGRYTCIGKGGVYTRIGTSLGAGECRGEIIEVYRDAENGQLYHRESGDFFFRMAAAPSKEGL